MVLPAPYSPRSGLKALDLYRTRRRGLHPQILDLQIIELFLRLQVASKHLDYLRCRHLLATPPVVFWPLLRFLRAPIQRCISTGTAPSPSRPNLFRIPERLCVCSTAADSARISCWSEADSCMNPCPRHSQSLLMVRISSIAIRLFLANTAQCQGI